MNDHTFINRFVIRYNKELEEALSETDRTLSAELILDEEFRDWFNEDWVADRWIGYVTGVVDGMSESEQTEILVEYGLDNVFVMARLIGLFDDPECFTTEKLTWHVIDHWYTYTGVINCFYNYERAI